MYIDLRDIIEDLDLLVLQNEDDFDRGSGKYIVRQYIEGLKKKNEENDVMLVAERIYREDNPNSKMDVPSFAYEHVEGANIRRMKAQSELSLYDWCRDEMKKVYNRQNQT